MQKFFHKIAFLAVLNVFPIQKLIFGHFWNSKKWNLVKKNFFVKLIYLISWVFAAWTFFSGLLCSSLCIMYVLFHIFPLFFSFRPWLKYGAVLLWKQVLNIVRTLTKCLLRLFVKWILSTALKTEKLCASVVLFHSEKSHPQLLSCVCQFHEKNNNKFSKKCSNRNYYYNNNKKNQVRSFKTKVSLSKNDIFKANISQRPKQIASCR